MSAAGVRAGRAFIEIGADDDQMRRILRQAQKRLADFAKQVAGAGAGLTAAGAAIAAPLAVAVAHFAKAGDALDKMSGRTGFTVETLSKLEFAMNRSGASMVDLEIGIRRMQRTIEEGLYSDDLARIGVDAEALAKMTPEQQFQAIADGISGLEDASARTAVAFNLFGDSGTKLLNFINAGPEGMRALTREADELGLTMSTSAAKNAAAFGDAMGKLKEQVDAIKNAIGNALAPALTSLAELLKERGKDIIDWVHANGQVIVGVAATAAGLAGLGTVLVGVAGAVAGLSLAVGGLAAALTFVLSPIGLVAVGLGAAATGFLVFTEAGRRSVGQVKDSLGSMLKSIGAVLGDVIKALTSGKLDMAANIAGSALRLAFENAFAAIRMAWTEMITAIRQSLAATNFSVRAAASKLRFDRAGGTQAALDLAADLREISKDRDASLVRVLSGRALAADDLAAARAALNALGGGPVAAPLPSAPPADLDLDPEAIAAFAEAAGTAIGEAAADPMAAQTIQQVGPRSASVSRALSRAFTFGARDPSQRTATATEKIAKTTEDLRRAVESADPFVFL